MKKNWYKAFTAFAGALFLLTAASLPALAAVPERPSNQYVLDEAGVLSDSTEKEIIRENNELFNECGAQVVVVAVDFLDGQEIDDYAYELFNDWGIGSSERNNGILLVLAIGEDNYYATSGYGLEDYFDGAKFRELLDEYLEEDFARGDYDRGVEKFFEEVVDEVENYYEGYEDEYTRQEDDDWGPDYSEEYSSGWQDFLEFITGLFWTVVLLVVIVLLVRLFTRGGRGGPPYGGGGGGGRFWTGMMLGSMMGRSRRRTMWGAPPPPPPGGFGGPRPGGHRPPGGFGGFTGGGRSGGGFGGGRGGFGGGGGFSGGGGTHGGGAGRH